MLENQHWDVAVTLPARASTLHEGRVRITKHVDLVAIGVDPADLAGYEGWEAQQLAVEQVVAWVDDNMTITATQRPSTTEAGEEGTAVKHGDVCEACHKTACEE